MNDTDTLRLIINILTFVMLLMALGISSAKIIPQMIRFYQIQSALLALIILLRAFEPDRVNVENFFLMLLPLILVFSIEPLLARATVATPAQQKSAVTTTFRQKITYWMHDTPAQAIPIWLKHSAPQQGRVISLIINLTLTIAAYIVAFGLMKNNDPKTNSLAVSMALLLLGLFTMGRKEDIISQIMGLLMMEHGMFLAAIEVILLPKLAFIFVISLFLYIIITLTILVFLLPELHRKSGTIEIDEQKQLKG